MLEGEDQLQMGSQRGACLPQTQNPGPYRQAFLEREQGGRRGSADLDPQAGVAGGAAGRDGGGSDAGRGGRSHSSAPDLMDIDGAHPPFLPA
jgi:hypothetical protein